MRCFKKSFSLLLAFAVIFTSVFAFSPFATLKVDAANRKYEFINLHKENHDESNISDAVKNGNYYVRENDGKIQVKNGSNGKYKTTKINNNFRSCYAGNGKFLYYIDKTDSAIYLKRYAYKTGKTEKIKKLPVSDSNRNDVFEYQECFIVGVYEDYIFFVSTDTDSFDNHSTMYSFNVKTKKIKRTGYKNFGAIQSTGEYFVAEAKKRTDFRTSVMDIYKFTKNGKVKKVKNITDNAYFVHIYSDSIYWIGISKNKTSGKNVLYTMKIDGTGKKKLFTETKKIKIIYVYDADDDGVYASNGEGKIYKYDFKSKKMKPIKIKK